MLTWKEIQLSIGPPYFVPRYREKRFIFIKCTHCTDKIGGAENAHSVRTSVVSAIKSNTKHRTSSLNIGQIEYVFALSAHRVQKVRQIENAIRLQHCWWDFYFKKLAIMNFLFLFLSLRLREIYRMSVSPFGIHRISLFPGQTCGLIPCSRIPIHILLVLLSMIVMLT